MSEWDELQRRNWGELKQLPPDPQMYAEVMKQAIAQAIVSQNSLHVIHVKLTITSPTISFTAELTYTPVQSTPALPDRQRDGIIMGDKPNE